jgi:hypothetical protein
MLKDCRDGLRRSPNRKPGSRWNKTAANPASHHPSDRRFGRVPKGNRERDDGEVEAHVKAPARIHNAHYKFRLNARLTFQQAEKKKRKGVRLEILTFAYFVDLFSVGVGARSNVNISGLTLLVAFAVASVVQLD